MTNSDGHFKQINNLQRLVSNSGEPFKELAKTIKQHWAGILKAFDASHLHTGYVEAVNSLLQAAKAKARGYGTTDHFIAMAFLIAGKLAHLPGNPLQKASA